MLTLYQSFWAKLKEINMSEKHRQDLIKLSTNKLASPIQGDYPRWFSAYNSLPAINNSNCEKDSDAIHCDAEISDDVREQVKAAYQQLIPWRKGPFDMFSTYIDSEWQSQMKWNRIQAAIPELTNKTVLDVGCGNGYYLFRMAEKNPLLLMGIDPGLLQILQFWSIEKYRQSGACILPITMQNMPGNMLFFDVVFSMGVLYHRKSPIHHIKELASALKAKGQLILETLVIDGDETNCLLPHGRYAQMRNVWFLPSVAMLKIMLQRNGFKNIRCIDVTTTTSTEQRVTQWMRFHSLKDFLNQDQTATIEGYPAPKRATLVAQKI
ncbi:MAG TPA: tRNA 5-methoxyuridine(34)/uridine 5-oxyacetic acid(34) synthase CmoB [Oceanospirillales bacterium]|nr:tRNA 5-methoxyuridine(34)/uridine 5-oxyacetic acid(34) synthase CmoB [Oceanospirillales bacterium]